VIYRAINDKPVPEERADLPFSPASVGSVSP